MTGLENLENEIENLVENDYKEQAIEKLRDVAKYDSDKDRLTYLLGKLNNLDNARLENTLSQEKIDVRKNQIHMSILEMMRKMVDAEAIDLTLLRENDSTIDTNTKKNANNFIYTLLFSFVRWTEFLIAPVTNTEKAMITSKEEKVATITQIWIVPYLLSCVFLFTFSTNTKAAGIYIIVSTILIGFYPMILSIFFKLFKVNITPIDTYFIYAGYIGTYMPILQIIFFPLLIFGIVMEIHFEGQNFMEALGFFSNYYAIRFNMEPSAIETGFYIYSAVFIPATILLCIRNQRHYNASIRKISSVKSGKLRIIFVMSALIIGTISFPIGRQLVFLFKDIFA